MQVLPTSRRFTAAAIAGVLLCAFPATAIAAPSTLVLDAGHIDLFEVTYDAGTAAFKLQIKDDTGIYADGAVYRDPSTVLLQVDSDLSKVELPEELNQEYRDLLGEPGDTIYLLDQQQTEGLPWPGWSAERLYGQLEDAGIELTESTWPTYATAQGLYLHLDISGPGEVMSWMNDDVPINNFIDTRVPDKDTIPVPSGSHVHTAWGFTAPGLYTFAVTPSATKVGGGEITGPTETYRWYLNGEPVYGPTGSGATFTIPAALNGSTIGRKLRAEVVARHEAGSTGRIKTFSSTVARGLAPKVSRPPTLTGRAKVGRTLRVIVGSWTPQPTSVKYRWYAGGRVITGATKPTLFLGKSLRGKRISAVVTANRTGHATGLYRTPLTVKVKR